MRIHLGLGANLGDVHGTLAAAVDAMGAWPRTRVAAVAGLYEGPYVGPGPAQPPYTNTVVALDTQLGPGELLRRARELEAAAGRSGAHMEARELDVDLLAVEGPAPNPAAAGDPELPHPRAHRRRFVLAPLAELAPDLRLGPGGEAVSQLLDDPAVRAQALRRVAGRDWHGAEVAR